MAEFAHGVRLLGMLLAPRGGAGAGAGFAPRASDRVVLESCSLGDGGRPRYVMRAAGGGSGRAAWPPHPALCDLRRAG